MRVAARRRCTVNEDVPKTITCGPKSLAQDSTSESQCSIFGLTSLAQDSNSGSQCSIFGLASLVETPSAATVVAVMLSVRLLSKAGKAADASR